MPTLLENLVSQMKPNIGRVRVHANYDTNEEIMDGIQEMYSFINFQHARRSGIFKFEIDNITLHFVDNPYIEERHFRLIPEKFFIEQSYLTLKGLGLIYRNNNDDDDSEERQDCINFCIANAIAFIPVNERLFIHDIYTNSPYKYVFKRGGVTTETINEAAKIASEILAEKIEHMSNYYKNLPPKWDN